MTTRTETKRILRGYTALARYMVTMPTTPSGDLVQVGNVANNDVPRTPFSYAPERPVYRDSDGDSVAILETSHRVYHVLTVHDVELLPREA